MVHLKRTLKGGCAIKVGIGFVNSRDAGLAGRRVIQEALHSGNLDSPSFVIAFCSGGIDHHAFLQGIRRSLDNDTVVVGGSAIGIITNRHLSYTGSPSGVIAVESDSLRAVGACESGLDRSGYDTAVRLARTLPQSSDDRLLTIFYDSIKTPGYPAAPPSIHASGPLIAGIEEARGTHTPIIGAGLVGDYGFGPTHQFCRGEVMQQSITGLLLSGSFAVYSTITHGYSILDGVYYTITGIDGDVIHTIDNKPIVEVIDDIYGHRDWRREHPVGLLSIGVNHGPPYEEPVEENYVNRLITGALPDGSGVRIFEPDMDVGTRIQFMLRDSGEIISSTARNANALMARIERDGARPAFALYIDCAGRVSAQSNTKSEEASAVQQVMNDAGVPLFGFYSGVEIAPMLGRSRGLDLTGVLTVVTEGSTHETA